MGRNAMNGMLRKRWGILAEMNLSATAEGPRWAPMRRVEDCAALLLQIQHGGHFRLEAIVSKTHRRCPARFRGPLA